MTLNTPFDHLVVAADSLERGIAHVERCLGARCVPGGRHPARGLPDAGLRLRALRGTHPAPARVRDRLASLSLTDVLTVEAGCAGEPARLQAGNETPDGLRWLD